MHLCPDELVLGGVVLQVGVNLWWRLRDWWHRIPPLGWMSRQWRKQWLRYP